MWNLTRGITLGQRKSLDAGANSFYSAGNGILVNLAVNRCTIRLCSFQQIDNKFPNQVEILPLYSHALSTQQVHIRVVKLLEPNCYCTFGPVLGDIAVGIATRYELDGPGIEFRWGVRFSAPVKISPGTHPASYTMCTRVFPGLNVGAWR